MKKQSALLLAVLLLGATATADLANAATHNKFEMKQAYSHGKTEGTTTKIAEAGKCGKGSCSAEMKKEKAEKKAAKKAAKKAEKKS